MHKILSISKPANAAAQTLLENKVLLAGQSRLNQVGLKRILVEPPVEPL
jgi:hypothetical protein